MDNKEYLPLSLLCLGVVIASASFRYKGDVFIDSAIMFILVGMIISMMGWIMMLIYEVRDLKK